MIGWYERGGKFKVLVQKYRSFGSPKKGNINSYRFCEWKIDETLYQLKQGAPLVLVSILTWLYVVWIFLQFSNIFILFSNKKWDKIEYEYNNCAAFFWEDVRVFIICIYVCFARIPKSITLNVSFYHLSYFFVLLFLSLVPKNCKIQGVKTWNI